MLRISEISQHFKKCFTYYDIGTRALQKISEVIGVSAQITPHFPGEKWVALKKIETSNIWNNPTDFHHSLFGK